MKDANQVDPRLLVAGLQADPQESISAGKHSSELFKTASPQASSNVDPRLLVSVTGGQLLRSLETTTGDTGEGTRCSRMRNKDEKKLLLTMPSHDKKAHAHLLSVQVAKKLAPKRLGSQIGFFPEGDWRDNKLIPIPKEEIPEVAPVWMGSTGEWYDNKLIPIPKEEIPEVAPVWMGSARAKISNEGRSFLSTTSTDPMPSIPEVPESQTAALPIRINDVTVSSVQSSDQNRRRDLIKALTTTQPRQPWQ
eukprot:GHVR01005902.1.p1 GENE.GHVR01005902.1~~GHVR01005902.1.p1  ORF type:complete len:290 (+),score=32.24 GHVR01005902.1:121-870(+)